jgi:hypothetical protein
LDDNSSHKRLSIKALLAAWDDSNVEEHDTNDTPTTSPDGKIL